MLGLHSKVQNPAIAGAITVIIVWLVKALAHQEIPSEVAAAITLVIMTITGYQSDGPTDDEFIQPRHPPPLDHK